MVNPKYVIFFSCVGLVLSFIICLISGISAGTMFIRALVFAVIFGILGAVVQIVYNKFLAAGDSSVSDASGSAKAGAVGNVINISVDDDKLPDDEVAPKFEVKNTAPVLTGSSPSPSEAPAARVVPEPKPAEASAASAESSGADAGSSGFKPVDLSSVTTKSPDSLDELPEIGDVSVSSTSIDSGIISSINDSGSGSSYSSASSSGGHSSAAMGDNQDAATYAKAISTLLAHDNN